YAGRQTEDIDATFDPALPLPVPLVARSIDRPAFSYRSTYKVEGRTLKIHREFVSRVPGQSCPAELEAQIAGDMNIVRTNTYSAFAFAGVGAAAPSAPKSPQTVELVRAVAADQKLRLDFLYSLNPDCTSIGFATVRILEEPKNGKITVENGNGFTTFPQNNPR